MKIYKVKSLQEFSEFKELSFARYSEHLSAIDRMKPRSNEAFQVSGYSYPAKKIVNFECDFNYGPGYPEVNWRERLVCPESGLNNRMRACVHLSDIYLNLFENSSVYIMEQVTPLYRYFREAYPGIIGSEFLGSKVGVGEVDENGIRNENATGLSFEDDSLDAVLSFDVFEHIPDFKKAFSECFRVLKRNGVILFTVPFAHESQKNIIRAEVGADGAITHNLEPEYHGDPISDGGVLCYQHFGWEIIDNLKESGFHDAFAIIFWSLDFGYFTQQIQFVAIKG